MLGYVTIEKSELKVREFEVYQGYYCGICKSIAKRCGQIPRMSLSYDAVFLALVLSGLEKTSDCIDTEHCIMHPIEKKPVIHGNSAVDYAADVMVILAYHKFLDDWHDEKSPASFAGKNALYFAYRKLRRRYTALCEKVETGLSGLSELEKSQSGSIDLTCSAFADIMEVLFTGFFSMDYAGEEKALQPACRRSRSKTESSIGDTVLAESKSSNPDAEINLSDPAAELELSNPDAEIKMPGLVTEPKLSNSAVEVKILAQLGRSLGKWIYALDALDDYEKDCSSKSYNPFIYRKNKLEGIGDLLYNYLAEISNAYDLLNLAKNRGIVENIIFMGIRRRTDLILREKGSEQTI